MFENQISTLGQFQGIQLETDISVITLNDAINHTYCSKIMWEQDNRMPIGVAKLIMPYSVEIASYWMKYPGAVVVHANFNSRPKSTTQAMLESLPTTMSLNMKQFLESQISDEDNKKISEITSNENMEKETKSKLLKEAKAQALKEARKKLNEKYKKDDKKENKTKDTEKDEKTKQLHFKNDEYNYAYIGKVARFKQVGTTFIVYLEDLGWKFMQKVPKEFRDAYISGQTLDNAFQAICEFMGVEFAYSIEDLSEYNFGADGYSVEKDGQVIEDVSTILSEWGKGKDDEEEEEEDEDNLEGSTKDKSMAKAMEHDEAELSGLQEYNKKKKKNKSSKNNSKTPSSSSLNSQVTNPSDDDKNNNNQTDNNKENEDKSNQQSVADKIEQYQEEFDDKIKHLFIGNTFYDSNISDPILNYDWITIVPTAPESTSSTSTTGANAQGNTANGNNTTDSNKNGWHDGQLYENGKIVLNSSYINSLPSNQAEQKYIKGQNTYTQETLEKLAKRASGARV